MSVNEDVTLCVCYFTSQKFFLLQFFTCDLVGEMHLYSSIFKVDELKINET